MSGDRSPSQAERAASQTERDAQARTRRELHRALAVLDGGDYAMALDHLAEAHQHLSVCLRANLTRIKNESATSESREE